MRPHTQEASGPIVLQTETPEGQRGCGDRGEEHLWVPTSARVQACACTHLPSQAQAHQGRLVN